MASITHTSLNLLTSDGTIEVYIVPGLTPDQYSELHDLVLASKTAVELRETIRVACDKWHREVHFN